MEKLNFCNRCKGELKDLGKLVRAEKPITVKEAKKLKLVQLSEEIVVKSEHYILHNMAEDCKANKLNYAFVKGKWGLSIWKATKAHKA